MDTKRIIPGTVVFLHEILLQGMQYHPVGCWPGKIRKACNSTGYCYMLLIFARIRL